MMDWETPLAILLWMIIGLWVGGVIVMVAAAWMAINEQIKKSRRGN